MPGTRNLSQATSQRPPQQSMLPVQQQSQTQQQMQQQQDDLFSSSSQLSSAQGGFRFGSQTTVGQSSQAQVNPADEFPPLNRNINGEIGQDRTLGLGTTVGFGAQSSVPTFGNTPGGSQGLRNNGLLNALSSSIRAPSGTVRVASPGGFAGKTDRSAKASRFIDVTKVYQPHGQVRIRPARVLSVRLKVTQVYVPPSWLAIIHLIRY